MEDFVREINAGSALFLLYGDEGVGKSRLLQELSKNRLAGRVQGIELKSGEQDGKSSEDRSAEIEKTFERAQEGDIIVADHFETALKKTRHQLFLSWATDGADKRLNLIICSSTDGFNELRQLTSQYQVNAQSFQLMPLDADEMEAFLGFHLFPNQPIGKLTIPADLRKQLAAARGRIGNLISIAEREGSKIEISLMTDTESMRQSSWVIASVLMVILLAATVGWYLFSGPRNFDTVADVPTQPEQVTLTVEESSLSESELAYEPEDDAIIESSPKNSADDEIELGTETDEEIAALEQAEIATESDELSASDIEPVPDSESEENVGTETGEAEPVPEPGTVTESEALAEAPPEVENEATPEETKDSGGSIIGDIAKLTLPERFERNLQVSAAWLKGSAAVTGTVQILLLSHDGFDVGSYFGFIEHLQRQQVDVSKLRVFKTLTANRVVYSVVYDEYESRQAAAQAINGLPQVLRDLTPIARSVGGLEEEIRRLEVNN